jgi:hypothetical protein
MIVAVYVLSVALFISVIVAGVGWYRYFVLQGYLKAINMVLGKSAVMIQEIDAKAKSIAADAVR